MIGTSHAGRWKIMPTSSCASSQLSMDCPDELKHQPHLVCLQEELWKLHAIVLTLLITLMIIGLSSHGSCHMSASNGVTDSIAVANTIVTKDIAAAVELISQQCLTHLLMIAGIEPNPGPDHKQQEAIIVQLCADSPSVKSGTASSTANTATGNTATSLENAARLSLYPLWIILACPTRTSTTETHVWIASYAASRTFCLTNVDFVANSTV